MIGISNSFCQTNLTGLYMSDEQRFENDSDQSKNNHRYQDLKIEIDISDITNMGYVKTIFPDKGYLKWDIVGKIDTQYFEKNNTLVTMYNAYMNIENLRTNTQFTIFFVKDYKTSPNKLHFVIESVVETRTWYHNLKRIN